MFISPMLLKEGDSPFDDKDKSWITELKLDGIRLVYSREDQTRLYTRHQTDITMRFPELNSLSIPEGTILDGELVLSDEEGKPDFEALMRRFMLTKPDKIKRAMAKQPVTYCVFDILQFKGKSVTNLPLLKRKDLLENILPEGPGIGRVPYVVGQGASFFALSKEHGLEGIVQKRVESIYRVGRRSDDWVKVLNMARTEVIITGIRKGKFGWLISFPDGKPAGVLELAVPPRIKSLVRSFVDQLKTGESDKYVYLTPVLRCRVKYKNLTKAGFLRQPVFEDLICL